jgi:hypothetical protein
MKTLFALITAIVLAASFAPVANANPGCDREAVSAYADFHGC